MTTIVDDMLFESADEAVTVAWSVIEAGLLRGFEDWARNRGADEACIARTRDRFAEMLRHSWKKTT